ncbi:MAG: intradiol ring-cleavage dioxygenase [Saprospiraceae bacterium]
MDIILLLAMFKQVKNVAFVMLLCSIYILCSSQNSQDQNTIVGGECEGCEAIYEYGNAILSAQCKIKSNDDLDEKMIITGTVFKNDGKTPKKNVIIYVYHTSRLGIYESRGNEKGWAKRHGIYRGWVKTAKDGKYEIHTFRPGAYPNRKIPEHIHMFIKEPQIKEYYIDDIVFANDPLFTKEALRLKHRGGSGLVNPKRKNGVLYVKRDIILGLNIPNY